MQLQLQQRVSFHAKKAITRMFETIITTDARIRAISLAILLNRLLGGVISMHCSWRTEMEVSGDCDSDSDSGCHVYESSPGLHSRNNCNASTTS